MSDWQVGDLAVCVDTSPYNGGKVTALKLGVVYRVTGVTAPTVWAGGHFGAGLILQEVPRKCSWPSWPAARFRKIRPDEREACEPEFVQLLKRSKVSA